MGPGKSHFTSKYILLFSKVEVALPALPPAAVAGMVKWEAHVKEERSATEGSMSCLLPYSASLEMSDAVPMLCQSKASTSV